MARAALWGTSVGYTETNGSVEIECPTTGRLMVVSKATFDYLYYKLDDFTAALKENCIEYVINDDCEVLIGYPQWYVEAYADGIMYRLDGVDYFSDEKGEMVIIPGSVILRNLKGELMCMDARQFDRYYDMAGGEME